MMASEMIVRAPTRDGQGYEVLGLPYRFGDAPRAALPAAPTTGEDVDGVLAHVGYSQDEIAALCRAGVLARAPSRRENDR